jgi:hypothetical protein
MAEARESKERLDEHRDRGHEQSGGQRGRDRRRNRCLGVGLEVVVLGVISGLRPATSQAAVIALLRTPAAARSLLAFTVGGFVVSMAVGVVVVVAFHGAGTVVGRSTFSGLFSLVAGVAAIGFAAGVQRGGVPARRSRPHRHATSRLAVRLREPSITTAAAAGVATHIPGLIYLAALNSIATGQPAFTSAAFQVALYNVLWFIIPLGSLTLAVRSPDTARAYLDRATAAARRNQERLLVVIFGALGVYLAVKGFLELR